MKRYFLILIIFCLKMEIFNENNKFWLKEEDTIKFNAIFDKIEFNNVSKLFYVEKEWKKWIINKEWKEIIPCEYDNVFHFLLDNYFYVLIKDLWYWHYDWLWNLIIKPEYKEYYFFNGDYAIVLKNKYGIIDRKWNIIEKCKYWKNEIKQMFNELTKK